VSQQTNWVPTSVDLEKPSAARIYDYVLGGNHNFAVDRGLADRLLQMQPELRHTAITNRAFLRRAVLFMLENGIRQFLDLGSGIPTVGNVHEIAQQTDPEARVVYVDYEHVAVAHSQLLLDGNPRAAMVQADITRPKGVLGHTDTQRILDFSQPIGLLAVTIGHYIRPDQDPNAVFAAYRDALAPGSFLALTHVTYDFQILKTDAVDEVTQNSQNDIVPRTKAEISEFFGDFELVEPGLATPSTWRPETDDLNALDSEKDVMYAGVARKG
jgi:SAM-dependent methyltransferase